MKIEQYLQQYLGIPTAQLEALSALFKLEHLKKGDFWLKQGQYEARLSFLNSGYLHYHAPAPQSGKLITQWIGSPGELVADLSPLMFQAPARWNIEALQACTLYTISSADYRQLEQWVPEWPRLEKLFLARCFTTLEQRVFNLLSLSAEQRYKALWARDAELFNQVPLRYLASMMHMSPETLSRIRAKKANLM
jgi:hypothetical protein